MKIGDFVCDKLGGHPLSIRIVARYSDAAKVDFDGLTQLWHQKWAAIGQYRPTMEAPLEASFELSYSSLDRDSKHVFLAMSLLPDGIAGNDIRTIWGDRDTFVIRSIATLDQRSLLENEPQGGEC